MKLFQFLVAALLLISSAIALAEKPDPNLPNPPLAVREANVDGSDWIRVHEQGTAKVDIQNTELAVNVTGGEIEVTGGEIEITGGEMEVTNTVDVHVDNIPSQQDVFVTAGRLSTVTQVFAQDFVLIPDELAEAEFGRTIDATTITISPGAHDFGGGTSVPEYIVRFYSPLVANVDPVQPVLILRDPDANLVHESISFTYPIPLGGLTVECINEDHYCDVSITVFGFLGSP
jgi:hypothetical protein